MQSALTFYFVTLLITSVIMSVKADSFGLGVFAFVFGWIGVFVSAIGVMLGLGILHRYLPNLIPKTFSFHDSFMIDVGITLVIFGSVFGRWLKMLLSDD